MLNRFGKFQGHELKHLNYNLILINDIANVQSQRGGMLKLSVSAGNL
jgi:hypothetical protein